MKPLFRIVTNVDFDSLFGLVTAVTTKSLAATLFAHAAPSRGLIVEPARHWQYEYCNGAPDSADVSLSDAPVGAANQ